MSDILLSVGMQKGNVGSSQLELDIKEVVSRISKNPPKVSVGLKVDQAALNNFKSQLTQIVNSVGLSKGAPITVSISGIGEITAQASKATTALKGVSDAAKAAADAVNNMGEKQNSSLKKINGDLQTMYANQKKWTAAQTGNAQAFYDSYVKQIQALEALKKRVEDNNISYAEYRTQLDSISAAASNAALNISKLGEDRAVKSVTELKFGTEEYRRALGLVDKELESVLGKLERWTAAKNGVGAKDYQDLEQYSNQLKELKDSLGLNNMSMDDFVQKLTEVKEGVRASSTNIRQCGEDTKSLGDKVKGLAEKFGTWLTVSQVIMMAVRAVKQMISAVIEIDAAMTELKKVTDETNIAYDRFLTNACSRARELGTTVSDVVNATADFARLGFGLEDASTLANTAIIYKNIGDGIEDITTASESIISTMQSFGVEASKAMSIVDKFNEVGNNFAISSAGIGDAMQRSAAAMASANNTIDETIALITAANTIVQNPDSVGTTLKTVSMYLRAAKTEAEEAGESTDGMASSVSELRQEILDLTGQQVDIQLDENTFKSTYQILQELSKVWDNISDVSQANLLELIGGKRNANVVSALLENFSVAEKTFKTSLNSAGSAIAEHEKHLDSINGKIGQFKAAFEELAATLIDSEFVKGVVDLGTMLLSILSGVAKLIDAFGGLNTVLFVTASTFAIIKAEAIIGFLTGLPGMIASAFTTAAKAVTSFVTGMTAAQVSMAAIVGSVAGIMMVVAAINYLAGAGERSAEKLSNLKGEFEDISSELETADTELKTIRDRIDELGNKDKLTFTEKEELENLIAQRQELERIVALRNAEAAAKQKEINSQFVVTMDQNLGNGDLFGNWSSGYARHAIESNLQAYQRNLEEINKLHEQYATDKDNKYYNDTVEGLIEANTRIEEFLLEKNSEFEKYMSGVSYINKPNSEDERRVNEYLDYINDFQDRMMILLGGDEAKTNAFNRLVGSGYSDITAELKELGKQGAVTAELLHDPKYDEFLQKMQELGVIADTTDDSLNDIALAFNSMGASVVVASDALEEIDAYAAALENFTNVSDAINSVSDAMTVLADLQTTIAEGFTISLEKALEFAKVYPEILNGATASADGQITLNENLVNSFIASKEAELKAQIDAEVAKLESDKAVLTAKMEFSKAQLELAQSVGTGEGQITKELAEYKVNAGNEVAKALINAGIDEADAYRLACAAMAQNSQEFNRVAAEVCRDVQGNFNLASYSAAQSIYLNMESAKASLSSVTKQAQNAALAISGIASGKILGSSQIDKGGLKAVYLGMEDIGTSAGNFTGTDFTYDSKSVSLEDFISDLELDISTYSKAIDQIDGQIAALKALRNTSIDITSGNTSSGSTTSGGSSSAGESWFEKEYKMHQHLLAMDAENVVDYLDWLKDAYKKAYEEGIITLDDYYSYEEEVYQGLRDLYEEVASNAKDAFTELVDYRVAMLKQEAEDERDALEEKLDYLKEFYDKQKDLLKAQNDEEKYLEEQSEKRKAVSDIRSDLAMLENDDSAWAQKRKLELQEELAKAEKDLSDFEKDHALDQALDVLDNAYADQEAKIKAEIDALDEMLNDPEALYNKALEDIKNNTGDLYEQMLEYNRKYGSGNDDDVKDIYEAAYKALLEYKALYGEDYAGVVLTDPTGYDQGAESDGQGTGASTGSQTAPPDPSSGATSPSSGGSGISKGASVTVKSTATHFGSKSGGVRMASFVPGSTYTVYDTSGNEVLIGRDGVYTGWINKSDIVGYASGTNNASAGLHRVDEIGTEYVFESPSDGTRYRMFHGGEKVLNAGATNFLYDFATSGGGVLMKMLADLFGLSSFGNISKPTQIVQLSSGDINIHGNADSRTVSEIRRAQRENLEFVIKEFNKLNK